ncbi:MAG: cytochrome P460 family protein [Rhodospirillales bacterium]|nr:cytochrome P460 family protein [Rhodospirillales bacterium]
MSKPVVSMAAAFAAAGLAAIAGAQDGTDGHPPDTEAEIVLRVPSVDYRKEWVQLGVFSVLADEPADGAKEIHAVYTARQNVDAYQRSGRFPDGTILVKDVFAARTEALTTGIASYAGALVGRFIMVKDAARKLGTSPRFGDGWGWAFYEGAETARTITTDYKTDCLGCHEPARAQDLIFRQGYPLLRN